MFIICPHVLCMNCSSLPYFAEGIDFICRIPARYPDEAPMVDVEVTKGLTANQFQELLQLAKAQVETILRIVLRSRPSLILSCPVDRVKSPVFKNCFAFSLG